MIIYFEKSIVSAKKTIRAKKIVYLGFQVQNQPTKAIIIFLHH